MGRLPWNRLWPGLPQLCQGSWQGLAVASAFAALLNFLLITTFGWTQWIPTARLVGWTALFVGWLVAFVLSLRQAQGELAEAAGESSDDLFRSAQADYLKGAWYEAEVTLNRLLRRDGRDHAARLMLASLFRHTKR